MGCCETRETLGQPIARAIASKNTVLALLRHAADEENGPPCLSPESQLSLVSVKRLIDIEEPELFVANKTLEEILLGFDWVEYSNQDPIRVKYMKHQEFGMLLCSHLSFSKCIPTELLLRVFNSPQSRLLWDSSLNNMRVEDGHHVLDANIEYTEKAGHTGTVNRYVRQYRESILVMNFVEEPSVKEDDSWVKECDGLEFAYIWQHGSGTIVEIVRGLGLHRECVLDASLKEYTGWSQKYFNEILYQMPR